MTDKVFWAHTTTRTKKANALVRQTEHAVRWFRDHAMVNQGMELTGTHGWHSDIFRTISAQVQGSCNPVSHLVQMYLWAQAPTTPPGPDISTISADTIAWKFRTLFRYISMC